MHLPRHLMLLLATAACCACSPVRLDTLSGCSYAEQSSDQLQFVRPTIEAYTAQAEDPPFYRAPDRKQPLRLTSFSYDRDFVGHSYRPLDTVEGRDGRYQRWLLDDCRVLYTPLPATP